MIFLEELQCITIHLIVAILHKDDDPHSWEQRLVSSMPLKFKMSSPCLTRCKTLLLVTLMLILKELQCFSHSLEWGNSAQRWCCSSRKTLRGRQYSFREQTDITIWTKLLDPLVSNIKDFLTRAAVLLPFTCMQWFWKQVMFLTHGNTER
jgi:hypothetical protein